MRRAALLLLAASLGLLVPSTAHADRLSSARDQGISEVSHSVTVRIDKGVARYRVRRTFANAGKRADEASLRLDLAHGAAITGLRIRARNRWYEGELMEAEEARAKYRELTGVGAWEPKDPALLQWVWADEAHLQVFPVLPGAVNTVEYTLTVPLEYRDGRYVLSYPRPSGATSPDGLPLATPVIAVEPGYGDARTALQIAEHRVSPGAPVVLGPRPAPPWVGAGEPEPGVGYAFSALAIDREQVVTAARVTLDIDHTYRGDLRVALVPPGGEHLEVCQGEGSDNDLRGTFELALPRATDARGEWTLVVADKAGLDVGTLDAWSLELETADGQAFSTRASGLPRFIPDAPDDDGSGGHAILELAPPEIRTLDARLGRVVASAERGFARLELDAAPQLRPLPRQASVVFVLDVSHSAEDQLDQQLLIAQAYVSHVPDARAELVVFDRLARRVFGEFVAAPDLADAIARARADGRLHAGNGSALERGLELAVDALDDRRGPARIVAITDAKLRTRFRGEHADRAMLGASAGSITHLVIPGGGSEPRLRRDDDHALAGIASAHRGVLYRAVVPADEKRRPALAEAMLGLVRPVTIDRCTVRGLDLTDARTLPASLPEGAGYRAMVSTKSPPRRVTLTGKIWAEDFRRVVRTSQHFDQATAAFVFSEDEHHELSRDEMLTVAFKGRAVSPVTSYLATEPGVRPSTEGIERGVIGFGGGSGAGFGGRGHRAAGGPASRLEELLAPAARRCVERLSPPAGWRVSLEVETTRHEIVDVQPTRSSSDKLRDCIVDEVWGTALPRGGAWPERQTKTVDFS